jgi:uncharacterized RDD family membrane protein YckC
MDSYCTNCGTKLEGSSCTVCGKPALVVAPPSGTGVALAGWWRRVGASLVDLVLLIVVGLLVLTLTNEVTEHLVFFFLAAGYFIYSFSRPDGQTVGNKVVGTQVRSQVTGGVVSLNQAALRWAMQYGLLVLTFVVAFWFFVVIYLLVDILSPLWDSQNQSLHDKVAKTVVTMV